MNEKTIAIGIDPGKDGAMAIVSDDVIHLAGIGRKIFIIPFDERRFTSYLRGIPLWTSWSTRVVCVLEHVGAMPGQGSVSMFNFGQNFGWIRGVLDACGIPYELVRPQKWKKEFSCTSDKNTSIAVAQRLFPGVDLRRTPKCKGPHDGICEALLMAEYARRHMA